MSTAERLLIRFQTHSKQIYLHRYEFNVGYCRCHVPIRSCMIYRCLHIFFGMRTRRPSRRNIERSIIYCWEVNHVENILSETFRFQIEFLSSSFWRPFHVSCHKSLNLVLCVNKNDFPSFSPLTWFIAIVYGAWNVESRTF